MNAKTAATGAGAATIPATVIVGAGLVASVITGLQVDRDHYRAEAGQPRPAVSATRTVTAVPATPPVASIIVTPTGATAVPVSDRTSAHASAVSASAVRPGSGAPSGPTPRAPSTPCTGSLLSAQLLSSACVSLGGR